MPAIDIPSGTLTLTGQYVGLAYITPEAGSLVVTGLAPTVALTLDANIAVPKGTLVVTGLAPGSAFSAINIPAGALSVTGRVPVSTVDLFGTASAGVPKRPQSWLTIERDLTVTSPPTTPFQWGLKPLSDTGRFIEGRLVEVGTIERGSSDKDGHDTPARLRVVAQDSDAVIKTRLAETEGHLVNREATYHLLSDAGRAAALTPRPLIKGRVVQVAQPSLKSRSVLELQDIIGSQFGPLDPDNTVGRVISDEHENLPEASRGRIYPILYGEFSDAGALDINGASAEKGVLQPVYVGLYNIAGGPLPSSADYGLPPTIDSDTVVGGAGGATYHYAVSLVTPYGESRLSTIVAVANAPGTGELSGARYVLLSGTYDATTGNKVRVWGRSVTPPNSWLAEATYPSAGVWEFADGADLSTSPATTHIDVEKRMDPPQVSTAITNPAVWGRFVVAIGEVDILSVFASDLADGRQAARTKLLASLDGVEFITPASLTWPHPDPYVELTNSDGITIRQTVFYLRGPRLQHHIDNAVTVAVNVCGYKGVNGLLINQAYPMLQSFLNEFVELNDGVGYTNGPFNNAIATFADGTPKFWSSRFDEAQQSTIDRIGGLGYIGVLAVVEPTTLREVLRRFFVTFGGHRTANHHGQIYPFTIPETSDLETGTLFRERMEIRELLEHRSAYDEIENRITYRYHYDWDTKSFRVPDQAIQDTTAIDRQGGRRLGVFQSSVKDCYFGNDPATMADRWQWHLALYAYPPRYVVWSTDLGGLETANGDPVRFSHRRDGLGATGEVKTPGVLLKTAVSVKPYRVMHTVRLLNVAVVGLEDEDVMLGNLGDETLGEGIELR